MVYQFDTRDAERLGDATTAAILYNIRFWCLKNFQNKKNFYDGKYWTYNSAEAFTKQFTWLSPSQIDRHLKKLREAGATTEGNYNKNKFDRTKWYSCNWHYDEHHFMKSQNGDYEIISSYTYYKPDTKPDKKEKAASLDFEIEKEKEMSFQASFEKEKEKIPQKRKTKEERLEDEIEAYWGKVKSFKGKSLAQKEFSELWHIYDKKNYFIEAIKAFVDIYKADNTPFQEILEHAKEYVKQYDSENKRFKPNLSKYLKERVYLTEIVKESKNGVLESKQSPTKLAGFRINR